MVGGVATNQTTDRQLLSSRRHEWSAGGFFCSLCPRQTTPSARTKIYCYPSLYDSFLLATLVGVGCYVEIVLRDTSRFRSLCKDTIANPGALKCELTRVSGHKSEHIQSYYSTNII